MFSLFTQTLQRGSSSQLTKLTKPLASKRAETRLAGGEDPKEVVVVVVAAVAEEVEETSVQVRQMLDSTVLAAAKMASRVFSAASGRSSRKGVLSALASCLKMVPAAVVLAGVLIRATREVQRKSPGVHSLWPNSHRLNRRTLPLVSRKIMIIHPLKRALTCFWVEFPHLPLYF